MTVQGYDIKDVYDEIDGFDPDEATNQEKLELSKMLLQASIGLMQDVADATSDSHAEAYMIDHLKIKASADHGFMSREFNMDEWIEKLNDEE